MSAPSSRAVAAQSLAKVLFGGQSLTAVLEHLPTHLGAQDKALVKELCFGVCRYGIQLQAIAKSALKKPIKTKETEIQALLLVGLYQLLHMRIPDHAAINTAVNAAKELKKPWAAGLINGVLRTLQRKPDGEKLWPPSAHADAAHPPWMVQALQADWPQHWQAITEANNAQAPMTLRTNQCQNTRQAYAKLLADAGIEHTPTTNSPCGITLASASAVSALPGFDQGRVSVQDEAAQLCPTLLALAPGQRVLDACAAPGGKTCHLLESEPELAALIAIELEAGRLHRIRENAERLKLAPTILCADANDVNQWWDGAQFDRILLDAPCSATGVIRRHPDIKWLRRQEDIVKLAHLQQRLLASLWPTLKPGGMLLYATCSILKKENEQTIGAFIEQTPDAQHVPIEASWGISALYGRQLLPQIGGHDGFYYARLRKVTT